MTGRMTATCILVFLFLAVILFSSEAMGKEKRHYLRWEPVENAVAYMINIRNSNGDLILEKRVDTSEHYFSLEPGTYRVRIGAVNRFEQTAWSDWSDLVIREPVKPEVSSVKPDELPPSSDNQIVIEGSKFLPGAEVKLDNDAKAMVLKECRVMNDEKMICRAVTSADSGGSYSLKVTNPGGLSDTLGIRIVRPEEKERARLEHGRIYIHGGYQFVQVMGKWNQPLNHGFIGLYFRGGVPLSRLPLFPPSGLFRYLYLEGEISYTYYESRMRTDIVNSRLHRILPAAYLSMGIPLFQSRFLLQVRLGGGVAWHLLVRDFTFGNAETSQSGEGMTGTGVSLNWLFKNLTLGAGVDYHLLFTGVNLSHSLVWRMGAGYRF